MSVGCCCLQRTAAASVAWQPLVRRGTASNDDACGIGIMRRLGLQRIATGYSAWLGFPVRYIVRRWRKRLLRITSMTAEVMCVGEASR